MLNEKNNLYEVLNWYREMGVDDVITNDLQEEVKIKKSLKSKQQAKISAPSLSPIQATPTNLNLNQPTAQVAAKPARNINFGLESPHKAIEDARMLANRANTVGELRDIVSSFEGCALKKTATNTVFGEGVSSAKIMLIGEAPGATEDAQGKPFCGDSGKLLDKMLSCIGLLRQKNFYITNTVFWRPPGNRQPTPQEIEICRPFVEKHIALINPELIVLVGSTAATSLIGNNVQITKIRKEYYNYTNPYLKKDIPVTAIFHPAYLLRQPLQKKTMWYDLLHLEDYIRSNNLI